MARWAKVFGIACVLSLVGVGCVVQPDDGERFREAVPQEGEVALRVPGGAGGTQTRSLHIATNDTNGEAARFYTFTRDMTNTVDFGTAIILGSVWAIVHSPPTSVEPKKATWGPGQATALEPAIYRFVVTEVGQKEYDYVLEGQAKGGGPWLTVMRGHGFGKDHPAHKSGWFEWDNDVHRTLDSARAKDSGKTKVTFDLRKLPATIDVALRPTDGKGEGDVKVTHEKEGAGSVDITAKGDLDPSKTTKLEDIHLLSRWTSAGSGRADVVMKNGDLTTTVTASECWSSSFARVYYKDTVNFEPATGDASVCAFSDAKL
jgi:hypothetical protein